MLGKLLKYDLKSMSRMFVPMWILCPVVAFLFSFSVRGLIGWMTYTVTETGIGAMVKGNSIVVGILGIVFFGIMVAVAVMTIMFVLQRFWNGLLKDEGYLMFTLPVETWELITAKGLCATIVTCLSLLVGVASFLVMYLGAMEPAIWGENFLWDWYISRLHSIPVIQLVAMAALYILLGILSVAKSIYQAYAAMALGQLFESHRLIGACVSYVGLSVILGTIGNIVAMIGNQIQLPSGTSGSASDYLYIVVMLAATVVQIVLFHVITERILSRKLNLE